MKETGADNFTLRKRVRNVLFGASLATAGVVFGMHHTAKPNEIVASAQFGQDIVYGVDSSEVVAGFVAFGGIALAIDAVTRRNSGSRPDHADSTQETIHN